MRYLKDNIIFLVITIVIMLGFYIVSNEEYIKSDPFEKQYEAENPKGNYVAADGRNIITDNAGGRLIVTDSSRQLINILEGSYDENNFSNATEVACDDEDNIYILDKMIDENNQYGAGGRIIKLDAYGQFETEIIGSNNEENSDIISSFYGLRISGKELYIAKAGFDGIEAMCIDTDTLEIVDSKWYAYEDAYIRVADISVNTQLEVCFATRSGVVYTFVDDEMECIYGGKFGKGVNDISLAYEVEYAEDNSIYVNDLGLKKIVRISEQGKYTTIIKAFETSDLDYAEHGGDIVYAPMYSGLRVCGDMISLISSDYIYDEQVDDYVYQYKIYVKNLSGEVIYNDCVYYRNNDYVVKSVLVKIALLVFIIILIYSVMRFIRVVRRSKGFAVEKLQIITLVTAIAAALFVAMTMGDNYNRRYADEIVNKLTNIAQMTCKIIDYNDIEKIRKPSDYRGENYMAVDEAVSSILKNETNAGSGMYCVVYKVFNNSVWEVYSDQYYHGGFYPMPGAYEGSAEQMLYETGETYVNDNFSNAAGSYMMVVSPVKNDKDEVVAIVEIGIDLSRFSEENSQLLWSVIMYVIMGIIVGLLLLSEFMIAREALIQMRRERKNKRKVNIMVIRPIVFVVFFAANMSTVFLPIYGEKLYTADFPLPPEMAAAFPLSAEMFMAALVSMLAGGLVDRYGEKLISIVSMFFYIGGLAASGFVGNLYQLIGANVLIGIGGGLFFIAINTYISSIDDDDDRGKGFSCFNAALASGANCGIVVGSVIAENIGYKQVFIIGALIILLSIILIILGMNKNSREKAGDCLEQTQADAGIEKMSVLRFMFTLRIALFLVMIIIPYLISASFLSYFFPLFGAENGLSEMQISLAFLISGVIAIYAGPVLTDAAISVLGCKRSIVLSSLMYGIAMLYFVINPGIEGCFVVVVIFSIADSFGLTSQDVYFSGLQEVEAVGTGTAMAAKSVYENVANVLGPIVFGMVLMDGIRTGIGVIAVLFIIRLAIYTVYTIFDGRKSGIKNEGKVEN